jgi:hypothetical protein
VFFASSLFWARRRASGTLTRVTELVDKTTVPNPVRYDSR